MLTTLCDFRVVYYIYTFMLYVHMYQYFWSFTVIQVFNICSKLSFVLMFNWLSLFASVSLLSTTCLLLTLNCCYNIMYIMNEDIGIWIHCLIIVLTNVVGAEKEKRKISSHILYMCMIYITKHSNLSICRCS